MTVAASTAPAPATGGSPFTGLPVAQTAGLRLQPGSPTAVFDQNVWDLSGLVDAPVVMSAHSKVLDFTTITHLGWRRVAP